MRRVIGIGAALGTMLALAACGEAPPEHPISDPGVSVTLAWKGKGDLDLLVDGRSGFLRGGSPDMTTGGGSEAYVFAKTDVKESIVVGAANRSAEPGGSGDTNILATMTIRDRDGRTMTDTHVMVRDSWSAFIVYPRIGTFTAFEEPSDSPPNR